MLPPFRMGLGGPIGNGRQYLPWIHIDDMVNAIIYLLDNPPLRGPFNMVAPYPVHNEQFTATLAKVLDRPAFLRAPAFAMRLLMGEAAVLVLGGQRAVPRRLEEAGFVFRFFELEQALDDVIESAGLMPPHPNPLPQGEGAASPCIVGSKEVITAYSIRPLVQNTSTF